jgi:hypothetical protein
VTKEVVKPILRKLAFDANYNLNEAVGDLLGIGVDIVAATKLAKAVVGKRPKIAKIAQAKIRDAVMRKLKDKPRARARAQKLPAVMETLMQAVGAGFPTEQQFLAAWTAKYGLPTLSTAERTRLRDMAARVNLLPEGVLRQSAAIEFLNEVALIKGISANEALIAAWYANVLSGVSTQAINVAGTGAKALNFTHIWRPCVVINVTAPSGQFTVGEVVTGGDSGHTGIVHKFDGRKLYLHTNTNVFQDAETLTGGTSGVTATSDGTLVVGLKARVPLAAAADTYIFNSAAHANNTFEIDIDPASLDKANNFDCIQMDVTAGTTASFVTINYLVESKYSEEPTQNIYIN